MTDSKKKVVLAYSGGVDTTVLIPWLQERGYDVICVCASLGQPGSSDIQAIADKATKLGAIASYAVDMRDEFCDTAVADAIAANAMYQNTYPLLSALSRPVICKHLVRIAHKEGAAAIAHGCTGKGNDQVRFTLECQALDPNIEILGPVREWEFTTRQSEIDYCLERGIQIEVNKESPYSLDENVWGRAIECGVLEDPWNKPPRDAWVMTCEPTEAPDEITQLEIGFSHGKPVTVNGKKLSMLQIVETLNEICGSNGFGRIDTIEDRVVGLKSRECYEQPAALALIKAHKALENLCLPADLLAQKLDLEHAWARAVYSGLWYTPLKSALDAFFASSQKTVTGVVRMELYKGSCVVTGLKSNHSMYDFGLATYDEGDTYDRSSAEGFMDLFGLPNKVWAQKSVGGDIAELDDELAEVHAEADVETPAHCSK